MTQFEGDISKFEGESRRMRQFLYNQLSLHFKNIQNEEFLIKLKKGCIPFEYHKIDEK